MAKTDFAEASSIDRTEIPVIDLTPALAGNYAEVAEAIRAAATEIGFFYITGHGIAPELIDRAFAVSRAFFDLPTADKGTITVNTQQRGWMATGISKLEGAATHDLKEVFFWGREVDGGDPDLLAGKPLVAQNAWPDAVFPDLKRDLMPYYNAVCQVGQVVMSSIAVSLACPPNQFASAYQRPLARGQLVYYPPSTRDDEAEARYGVAPHTDFGVLTLLLQDDSGGLQVKHRSGAWVEAPPVPGTLVCNIGDLLQRWSNDRLTSTVHRVINRSGHARYSIPVFFDPRTDTSIDPCALSVAKEDSKYPPVSAGDYISGRNKKSFAQYKT